MRKFRNRLISALLAVLLAMNPMCINMISAYAESSAGEKTESVTRGDKTDKSEKSENTDTSSVDSQKAGKAEKTGDSLTKRSERSEKNEGESDKTGEKSEKLGQAADKSDGRSEKSDQDMNKSDRRSERSDEDSDKSDGRSDKSDKGSDESGEAAQRPDKADKYPDKAGDRSVKGGVKEKENNRRHNIIDEENEEIAEADKAEETEDTEEDLENESEEAESVEKTVVDVLNAEESYVVDPGGEEKSALIIRLLPLEQDVFVLAEKPDQKKLDDILPKYLYAVAAEDEEEEDDDQVIIRLPISWECWDDFSETDLDSFTFDAWPEWDEDVYELADGEELPSITIVIAADMVILTKNVDGIEVTITAPAGVFPADAKLKVDKITSKTRIEDAADAIAQYNGLENEETSNINLFDIRILDADGEEIQPEEPVTLSFRYTEIPGLYGTDELVVYQFEDDETTDITRIDAEQEGDILECEVENLSVFAILSDIEYLADDLYEISFSGDAPEYIYDGFVLYERNLSEFDAESYLKAPAGWIITHHTVKKGTIVRSYYNTDELKAVLLTTAGEYEWYMVVNDEVVASLTFTISERPSLTIALTENVETNPNFYKIYGDKDPSQPFDLSDEYFDIIEFLGADDDRPTTLTNVTFTRESGEELGKYKILTMNSDKYGDIILIDNDYNYFSIINPPATSGISKTLQVFADGFARTISISDFYSFSNDKTPTGAKVSEMSDEALAYFSSAPVMSGFDLKFTLKESDKAFTVDIPIELENPNYSYGTGLTVTLQAQPRIQVESHTEDEIRNYYNNNSFSTSRSDTWSVNPDISKDIGGTLSDASRENSLNALNFMRYIAGIDEVGYSEDYEVYTQAGSTLLSKVNKLTHFPSQPSDVSDSFYKIARTGTSESNIAWATPNRNIAWHIINGWMDDGDEDNIDTVGHRRWCLDPNMLETAFGHSGNYATMYAWDSYNNGKDEYILDFVPWPAREMPIDYFCGPWCVSLGKNNYALKGLSADDLKITMECSDGKTYTLDSSNKNTSGKYFNYESGNYGYGAAVIFEPNVTFKAGDEVKVTITGLKDSYGTDTPITYTVNFFKMNTSSSSSSGGSGGSSGGGGGGGGSSGGSGVVVGSTGTTGPGGLTSSGTLPDYVVQGSWINLISNIWEFMDTGGNLYVNKWAAIYNPYADTSMGQQAYDWFCFDENGFMRFGWYQDPEGNMYYLNPVADGTLGAMFTGWHWIADDTGTEYYYYFNPNSDGYRGKLLTDTVIDGYTVDALGRWTVDGVAQIAQNLVSGQ